MLSSGDSPAVEYCMGLCFLICHNLCVREARVAGREDCTVPMCTGGWVSTTCFCLAHGAVVACSCAGSGQGQDSWHTQPVSQTAMPESRRWAAEMWSLYLSFCPLYLEECTKITKGKIGATELWKDEILAFLCIGDLSTYIIQMRSVYTLKKKH